MLQSWTLSICIVSIFGAVLIHLLPSGCVTVSVHSIYGLIVLLTIITPFVNGDMIGVASFKSPDDYIQSVEQFDTESVKNILLSQTEERIRKDLEIIVEDYYSGDYNIQLDADILSDYSISMNCIMLHLTDRPDNQTEFEEKILAYSEICEIKYGTDVSDNREYATNAITDS